MSDIIHLLPDSIANQIAAGEVIQRPASVVKELVENSIDAHAKNIQIVVKDAGRTAIFVTDDGIGMSETDARIAFERHATSKITSANDLFALKTMGFRGEALASIAAVAQVEMRTRKQQSETGCMIEISGSVVQKQEIVSCQKGTSFCVKNLFFNVPARRKFLKSNNTELRHITEFVQRIVLTYPEIEFSFHSGETEIFHLKPSNLRQRIIAVFGKKVNQVLLPVAAKTGIVSISGFVGKPEFAYKGSPQFFFVNGRYMRHSYFHRAVMEAYSRMLKPETVPAYFIYFDIDPSLIDVNVHPTKTEIKFQDEREIWQILFACIKESLGKFNVVPSIDFDTEGNIPLPPMSNKLSFAPAQPVLHSDTSYNPFGNQQTKVQRPIENWDMLYGQFEKSFEQPICNQADDHMPVQVESLQPQLFEQSEYESVSYFPYKNKYLFTSVKSGLMMIHVQRAQTQIFFEQYIEQLSKDRGVSQQILFPENIELDSVEANILQEILQQLQKLGFDIEKNGHSKFTVKGVPSTLVGERHIEPIVHQLIGSAKDDNVDLTRSFDEQLAFVLAKASAAEAMSIKTNEQAEHLTERLFSCKNHLRTIDGKLILKILTDSDIDAEF